METKYGIDAKKNTEIKVSVIIPVCNVEKYLRKCLDSVCRQTLKDIEIICVEDCSEDSSAEIVQEYAEKDKRIVSIFHKENLSTSQSRKDGVLASRGKYVMFLDGDDELYPEACEKAYDAIELFCTDMVQFNTTIVNCAGVSEARIQMNQRLLEPYRKRIESENLIFSCWEERKFGFSLWNKIYKGDICRKAFSKVKDGAFPKAQDLYAFFLIAYYSRSYQGIEEALYQYKFGLGVTGRNYITLDNFDILLTEKRVWESLKEFAEQQNQSDKYLSILNKIYDHFLGECVNRWKANLLIEDLSEGFRKLVDTWGLKDTIGKLAEQNWDKSDDIAEKIAEVDYFNHKKRESGYPKTVAMYYRSIKNGGAQRVVASLCNIWADMCDEEGNRLYKVVLITDAEDEKQEIEEYELNPAVQRAYIPAHDKNTRKLYVERYLGWERVIREHQIDVVVTGMWVAPCVFWDMLSVKGQPSKPAFVIHCHSFTCLPYRVRTAGNKFAEMMYNYQICDGTVVLSKVDQKFVGSFSKYTRCICNPLTFSVRSTEMINRNEKSLVWIGRISGEKRPLDVVYMMSHIVKAIPDVKLYLIGDGEPEVKRELDELIERFHLQENIIQVGFTLEIEKYYQQASVLIGTSEYEGFSLVFCEAMAYGLPIVTYELPWLTLTQDGRGVIQVPQRRSDLLAEKVIELLRNPSISRQIGMEGREQIEELQQIDIGNEWKEFFEGIFGDEQKRNNRNPNEIEDILFKYITLYSKIGKDFAVGRLNNKVESLNKEIKKLREKNKRLTEQNEKLKNVKKTATFKIGKVIMFIPRSIVKIVKKIIG